LFAKLDWLVYQVVGMCVAGGCGAKYSKVLGDAVYEIMCGSKGDVSLVGKAPVTKSLPFIQIPIDPETFDPKFVTKFVLGGVATGVKTMLETNKGAIDGRLKELETAMTLNPKWVGAFAKLDWDFAGWDHDLFECESLEDAGANPFVSTNKLNCWRWGPAAVPLPGVACLITSLDSTTVSFVQVFPISKILSHGIALKDMSAFLQTPVGADLFSKFSKLAKLSHGEVLFVPYGMCAAPMFLDPSADTKRKQKLVKPHSPLLFLPLFNVGWAKQVSELEWKAIESLNSEHFIRTVANPVYSSRKPLFDKFVKNVAGN
jgi:hypothetical protein